MLVLSLVEGLVLSLVEGLVLSPIEGQAGHGFDSPWNNEVILLGSTHRPDSRRGDVVGVGVVDVVDHLIIQPLDAHHAVLHYVGVAELTQDQRQALQQALGRLEAVDAAQSLGAPAGVDPLRLIAGRLRHGHGDGGIEAGYVSVAAAQEQRPMSHCPVPQVVR